MLFGVASLAGGLAWSPGGLIAARAVQGIGAAALAPVAFALIAIAFPAGPARSRALGLWGMAGAAGGAVGVLAGGVLTDAASWRAVMLVNVPIVVFALVGAVRSGLESRPSRAGARLDVAGALLATAGTALLVLGLVRTSTHPWGSAQTLSTLGAAVLLLVAFAAVELRAGTPLLRLGLLKGRPVLTANLFCLLMSSGQFAAFYFAALYMQQVLGYGPTAAGAAFLPFSAGVVAGSVVATRTVAALGGCWRRAVVLPRSASPGSRRRRRRAAASCTRFSARPWSAASASGCASYRSAPRPRPTSLPTRRGWPPGC